MKRKEFIKRSSFAIGATAVSGVVAKSIEKQILKSKEKLPNLVIITLSGGIRNADIFNESGNGLMPNLCNTSNKDSANSIVFKDVQCPTNNHKLNLDALIFGGISDNSSNQFPSLFEYCLANEQILNDKKQYNPLKCWYLAENLGNKYNHLAHSDNPKFGKKYGANTAFSSDKSMIINSGLNKDQLLQSLNYSISKSQVQNQYPELNAISTNTGLVNKFKNAALILNTFQPKLFTFNISDMDICHSNFTGYQEVLSSIDKGIDWLCGFIQTLETMKNNTIVIIVSTLGRNEKPNSIKDKNNKLSFDHNDISALKSFAVLKNYSKTKISRSNNPLKNNIQLTDIHHLCHQILTKGNAIEKFNPEKSTKLIDFEG
jgi:hypothetical protein